MPTAPPRPDSDEIIVTPEMAEAGSIELTGWEIGVDHGDVIVSAVYRKMVEARRAELRATYEASPIDHLSANGSPEPSASS